MIDIADGMSDIGVHVSSPKISSLPKGYALRDEVILFWNFGENMRFFFKCFWTFDGLSLVGVVAAYLYACFLIQLIELDIEIEVFSFFL